jgi:hypothetical protein
MGEGEREASSIILEKATRQNKSIPRVYFCLSAAVNYSPARNMYSIHLAQLTNSKLMTPSCVNALIARIFPLDRAKEVLLKMPLVKP